MKIPFLNRLLAGIVAVMLLPVLGAHAQRMNVDFVVKKLGVEFIKTPDYSFSGNVRRSEDIGKWMEIEAEFEALPEFTEELTFRYYVQINKLVFVGDVTHVSIPKGRALYSVMYISPRALNRIMEGKVITANVIERISVEVSRQGQLLAYGAWKNEKQGWWATLPQKTGFLVNKSQTPFAPLYWDRYEAIKSTAQ